MSKVKDTQPVNEAPLIRAFEEQEMIMHLEPDQLVEETMRPLPRAKLSRGALRGLWALRFFALIASAMVIYTFFQQIS
jgi:hypothetical protein